MTLAADPREWTADQLEECLHQALQAHDVRAVEPLLMLMASKDPYRAELLLDTIKLGITLREKEIDVDKVELWKAFGSLEETVPHTNFEGAVEAGWDPSPEEKQRFEEFDDGSKLLTVWRLGQEDAISEWRHQRDALVQA